MDAPNPEEFVKLFVGNLPRDVGEDELIPVFKEYGSIVEVHVIRDRHTKQSKGSAFIKFGTIDEANACISALNNVRVFDQSPKPIEVRLASGEEARIGAASLHRATRDCKLFVGKIPLTYSEDDLRDLFSTFGDVQDVVLKRNSDGTTKGFGFVKLNSLAAAETAIRELNGSNSVPGGLSLRVEFADVPKSSTAPVKLAHKRENPPFVSSEEVMENHFYQMPSAAPPHLYNMVPAFGYFPPPTPPRFHAHSPFHHPMAVGHMSPVMHTHLPPHPATVFVGGLPNHVTREELIAIFAFYGTVLEVQVMRPKSLMTNLHISGFLTGMIDPIEFSRASAFVTFATIEEANYAILNVNGYPFPGTTRPIIVKHYSATATLPEVAPLENVACQKLFVGGIPSTATDTDVLDVFALFGSVQEVYLLRHSDGQSKGSAFVRYTTPEMGRTALLSVNGKVTMKGGNRPLTVKFAETNSHTRAPKKRAHHSGGMLGNPTAPPSPLMGNYGSNYSPICTYSPLSGEDSEPLVRKGRSHEQNFAHSGTHVFDECKTTPEIVPDKLPRKGRRHSPPPEPTGQKGKHSHTQSRIRAHSLSASPAKRSSDTSIALPFTRTAPPTPTHPTTPSPQPITKTEQSTRSDTNARDVKPTRKYKDEERARVDEEEEKTEDVPASAAAEAELQVVCPDQAPVDSIESKASCDALSALHISPLPSSAQAPRSRPPSALLESGVAVSEEVDEIATAILTDLGVDENDTGRGVKHSMDRGGEAELPKSLFVKGIPHSMLQPQLEQFFSMYGTVVEVYVMRNEGSQENTEGCAFVRMATLSDSDKVIRGIDGVVTLPGGTRPLVVQYANSEDITAKRQRR